MVLFTAIDNKYTVRLHGVSFYPVQKILLREQRLRLIFNPLMLGVHVWCWVCMCTVCCGFILLFYLHIALQALTVHPVLGKKKKATRPRLWKTPICQICFILISWHFTRALANTFLFSMLYLEFAALNNNL